MHDQILHHHRRYLGQPIAQDVRLQYLIEEEELGGAMRGEH